MGQQVRISLSEEAYRLLSAHIEGREATMGDVCSQALLEMLAPSDSLITPKRVYGMLETLHDLLVALAHRLEHLDAPASAMPTPPPAPSSVPQPTPPPAARSGLSRLFFRED